MNKKHFLPACLITLMGILVTYQTALAHEHIIVGDYEIVVGWASEPPVARQANAVEIRVSNTSTGEPVGDVTALTVAISYGGQSKTLTLQPLGTDSPGEFVAPIVATRPGRYTLSLGGMLGDAAVDAEVELEEMQPADTIEFPSAGSTAQGSGRDWLVWVSMLTGLVGVGLGVVSLRKTNSR